MMKFLEKNKYSVVVILLALIVAVGVVFASFTKEYDYEGEGTSAGLSIVFTKGTGSGYSFSEAGEVILDTFSVENDGTVPFTYNLVFSVPTSSILAKAVILWVDGKEIGNLALLTNQASAVGDSVKYSIAMPHTVYPQQLRNHTIGLEYHIGASDIYNNTNFDLDITAEAVSVDVGDYAFIGSSNALKQALTNKNMKNYTLVLTSNITLGESLVATNMANIDLNGYTLTGNITFGGTDEGVYNIYSSVAGGAIDGTTTLNNASAVLLSDFNLTVTAFDNVTLKGLFKDYLKGLFGDYVGKDVSTSTVSTIDIKTAYKNYLGDVVLSKDKADVAFSDGTFTITHREQTYICVVTLSVADESETIPMTVLGYNDLTALEYVLTENVALSFVSDIDQRQIVTGDLFLPVLARDRTTTIQWFSSDESVIDKNGFFKIATIESKDVTLTAAVNINNNIYLHNYYIKASPSLEKIKSWFELNNILYYTQTGQTRTLYTSMSADDIKAVSGYESIDWAISDITYEKVSINTETINYFTIDDDFGADNQCGLVWSVNTQEETSTLAYTLTIAGVGTIDGELDMFMIYNASVDIFKIAYDELMKKMPDSGLALLGGFATPPSHELSNESGNVVEVLYSYELKAGTFDIEGVSYTNPSNIDKMARLISDNKPRLALNPYMFPRENTTCYITLTITFKIDDESTEVRNYAIPFTLAGIIHYADDDIKDFSLYTVLLEQFGTEFKDMVFEVDNSGNPIGTPVNKTVKFITADTVANSDVNEIDLSGKGIEFLNGIEFFTNLTEINLADNTISDLSPLAQMYQLEVLNLSNNKIVGLGSLTHLTSLIELDLSNSTANTTQSTKNDISDISSLENLVNLQVLKLQNNGYLNDFSPILNFEDLRVLYAYGTPASDDIGYVYNQNYFVTSYLNAEAKYDSSADYKIRTNGAFSPTQNEINVSNILNAIVPSYQFRDVLYLPFSVNYAGTNYVITWSTNSEEIVEISGDKATITQPVVDANIKLYAAITVDGKPFYRVFDVRAIAGNVQGQIIVDGQGTSRPASDILDDNLRYHLFNIFDLNSDGIIDYSELSSTSTNSKYIDLFSKNISDLTGLEYFTFIQNLSLEGNDINNFDALASLTALSALTITYPKDEMALKSLYLALDSTVRPLMLTINDANVNCPILNECARRLKFIYGKDLSLKVNKKSYNPFEDMAIKALSQVEGYYALYKDGTPKGATEGKDIKGANLTLSGTGTFEIESVLGLPNEQYAYKITYEKIAGLFSFNGTTISLNEHPIVDDYGNLSASLAFIDDEQAVLNLMDNAVKRTITVISLAQQIYLKNNTGSAVTLHNGNSLANDGDVLLSTAIPSELLRKALIAQKPPVLDGGKLYINLTDLRAITNLTASGYDGQGLNGLELFTGLVDLMIEDYRHLDNIGELSLSQLLTPLTNLVSLRFRGSIVDMQDLKNSAVPARIVTLDIQRCISVNFGDILAHMPNLEILNIINNSIKDFSFLTHLPANHKCYTILAYNNETNTQQDQLTHMGTALSRLHADYLPIYNYYMYSSSVKYGITTDNLTLTYTNTQDSTLLYAMDGNAFAHYLTSEGTINLPKKTDKEYPIVWSSSAGSVVINQSSDTENIVTIPASVAATYMHSYVIITARVTYPSGTTDYKYYFVIKSTLWQSANPPSGRMDISEFMPNDKFTPTVAYDYNEGEFVDPFFANIFLKKMEGHYHSSNGTFNQPGDTSITFTAAHYSPGRAIRSIHGIQVLANTLQTFVIEGWFGLADISPVRLLTQLTNLRIENQKIDRICDNDGNSYFTNLTQLVEINFKSTPGNFNYLPIVYSNIHTTIPRVGLSNLKKLDLSSGTEDRYYVDEEQFHYLEMLQALYTNGVYPSADGVFILYDVNTKLDSKSGLERFLAVNYYLNSQDYYAIYDISSSSTKELTIPSSVTVVNPALNVDRTLTLSKFHIMNNLGQGNDKAFAVTKEGGELSVTNANIITSDYTLLIRVRADYYTAIIKIKIKTVAGQTNPDWIIYINENETDWVDAKDRIPDENLRFLLFRMFGATTDANGNKVISNSNRLWNQGGDIWYQHTFTTIKGIELFPATASWTFYHLTMTEFPEIEFLESDVANNKIGIKNLAFYSCTQIRDFDNLSVFAPYLESLIFNNGQAHTDTSAVTESIFNVLSSFEKLKTVKIEYINISDFSGILKLPETVTTISFKCNNTGFDIFPANVHYIRQWVLSSTTTTYFYRGTGTGNSNVPNASAFNEYFVYDRMKFEEAYSKEVWTKLPDTFRLGDTAYSVTYEAIGSNYQLVQREDGWYINMNPNAPMAVDINVYVLSSRDATKRSYREKVTLIVGDTEVPVEAIDVVTEGTIEVSSGEFEDAKLHIPDQMLRMYFFAQVDADGDHVITIAEMNAITSFNINIANAVVTDFTGIELLANLTTLNVRKFNTRDLDPIYKLTNLTSLTIYDDTNPANTLQMYDLSGMGALTNLKTLDIKYLNFTDLNFLEDLTKLEVLVIGTDRMFTANTARMNNTIFNRVASGRLIIVSGGNFGDLLNAPYAVTEHEKLAGIIFSDFSPLDDYSLATGTSGVGLSPTVFYNGVVYDVEYESLSPALVIDSTGNTLSVVDADGREWGAFIARIVINDVAYEKYFVVRIG